MISFLLSEWGLLDRIEDVSFVPFCVELFLDELYNAFLLSFYASLFFSETIQLSLFLSYFFPICVHIGKTRVGILIPDVEDGEEYVSAQIVEGVLIVSGDLSFVVRIVFIIERMSSMLKYFIIF